MSDLGAGFAVLGAGALTIGAYLARGESPPPAVFIGSAVAGVALVAVASHSPALASKFGTLILITAILTNGIDLARGVNNAIGHRPAPEPDTTKGPTE